METTAASSSLAATPASSSANSRNASKLMDVNIDDFLKLMIAELQNQDPLDPMKNSEMLQQLSHIRTIGASDQLSRTLEAVLMGQNLSTASTLIGKDVSALTDQGINVTGRVDRVTASATEQGSRTLRVHIGDHSIALQNVREILPPAAD